MLGKMVMIAIMLASFAIGAICQSNTSGLSVQMEVLSARMNALESENHRLRSEKRSSDSIRYLSLRTDIFNMFTSLAQLDFDFNSTTEKIAMTELFCRLMQANNPSSDVLGFRFNDIILSAAEKHFQALIKNEEDKKRFSNVLTKIISNPVVSSLAGTNPVTSVVSAVISTVAGFSTSRVQIDREGGRVKNVAVAQQDIFNSSELNAFRKELQLYIDFYDAMIINTSHYLKGLEELKYQYTPLRVAVDDFNNSMNDMTGSQSDNPLLNLSNTLPDPKINGLDFGRLLENDCILDLHELRNRFDFLHRDVMSFKMAYHYLLMDFLTACIQIIGTTSEFPENVIDRTKAQLLIKDIEKFIEEQH